MVVRITGRAAGTNIAPFSRLSALHQFGPWLAGMGLVAGALLNPATASAEEEAAPAPADVAASKAKETTTKSADKTAAKAKEATRDLKDGEPKSKADAKDAKGKAERRKGSPEKGVEEEEKQLGARVPWRGTSVSWANSFTTSSIGVGDDFQSGAFQTYNMHFGALLNYFVVDQPEFRMMVNTAPGFSVELTDSGTTTTRREPVFDDLPITVTGQIPIYSDKEYGWFTSTNVRARALLPTSPGSQNDGTYLRTQVGAVLIQGIPMAYKAEHFKAIYLIGSLNYVHRFADATTPVSNDLNRPRQNAAGNTVISDVLSPNRVGDDTLREGLFLFLGEQFGGWTFQLFGGFSFSQTFLNEFESDGCDVIIDTGCAEPSGDVLTDPATTRYAYGTSIGLSIFPWPEVGVNLGYNNSNNSLGTNGQRRSIFYNPNSQFSFGMSFSPDALFERATGPKRARPFVIF